MNNAETNIVNDPLTGALASITRIGGGEVRVNQALDAPIAAWDSDVPTGALGFGFVDVTGSVTLKKTVRIRNYDNQRSTYTITPTFRFANDQASGAVSVSAPANVTVLPGRGRDTTFDVSITIDGSKLPANAMNSGSNGAAPAPLTLNEYDGYLKLTDGSDTLNIPWHVLPRKAASVAPNTSTIVPGSFPQVIGLNNTVWVRRRTTRTPSSRPARTSRKARWVASLRRRTCRAVGINTFPVPAGFCSASASFLWVFAVNTHERQEHLLPVSHQVWLDTNQDGTDDYVVLNRDASGLSTITDGRQLTWALNLTTGAATALWFAEHSMNTGNTALIICGEQIGMNAANLLETSVDMDVVAAGLLLRRPWRQQRSKISP